ARHRQSRRSETDSGRHRGRGKNPACNSAAFVSNFKSPHRGVGEEAALGWITETFSGGDLLAGDDPDIRIPRLRYEQGGAGFYAARFRSLRYAHQLNSTLKREVVIKVVSRGVGQSHARTIMRYLMRDLSYQ